MSQLYRIRIRDSVSRVIQASDQVTYPVRLTEIQPLPEMLDLLRAVLRERGWCEREDGRFESEGPGGEELVFDLERVEVTASLNHESIEDVEIETEELVDVDYPWQISEARKQLLEHERKGAEQHLDHKEKRAQTRLTEALEAGEEARLEAINELLQPVYAESLKRKARQLGEVMELTEGTSDGRYELTIRVSR